MSQTILNNILDPNDPTNPSSPNYDPSLLSNIPIPTLQAGSLNLSAILAAAPSGSSAANQNLTLILNKIYALLVAMVGVIQNVTAAQAQRLNILTQWQAAYTDALTKVHSFTSADSKSDLKVPANLLASATFLSQINTKTQNLTTTLQGSRSAVSDASTSMQSSVNASNDAVTQQANIATSFIQELTTLLQAIYR